MAAGRHFQREKRGREVTWFNSTSILGTDLKSENFDWLKHCIDIYPTLISLRSKKHQRHRYGDRQGCNAQLEERAVGAWRRFMWDGSARRQCGDLVPLIPPARTAFPANQVESL